MILLDTDICIELLRGNRKVIESYGNCDDIAAVSFMTVGELYYGAEKSAYVQKNTNIVDAFLLTIDVIDTGIDILKKFGGLKAALSDSKTMLPDADIFIAATAMTRCNKLITSNLRHFKRFEGLVTENWI
ncbi:PIN domain-containing protein [bacterium]|nr:PIN domain-containing protein [bacterium]